MFEKFWRNAFQRGSVEYHRESSAAPGVCYNDRGHRIVLKPGMLRQAIGCYNRIQQARGQNTLRAACKEGTPEEARYHVGNHPGDDNDSPKDRLKHWLSMTHQHG